MLRAIRASIESDETTASSTAMVAGSAAFDQTLPSSNAVAETPLMSAAGADSFSPPTARVATAPVRAHSVFRRTVCQLPTAGAAELMAALVCTPLRSTAQMAQWFLPSEVRNMPASTRGPEGLEAEASTRSITRTRLTARVLEATRTAALADRVGTAAKVVPIDARPPEVFVRETAREPLATGAVTTETALPPSVKTFQAEPEVPGAAPSKPSSTKPPEPLLGGGAGAGGGDVVACPGVTAIMPTCIAWPETEPAPSTRASIALPPLAEIVTVAFCHAVVSATFALATSCLPASRRRTRAVVPTDALLAARTHVVAV